MPFCPQCGIDNPASARFCDQCGAVLVPVGNTPTAPAAPVSPVAPTIVAAPVAPAASSVTCAQCGAPAIPGEAFCDNCGAPLNAPSMQPAAPPAYSQPTQAAYPPPQPAAPPAYSQPVQPAAPPAYSQPVQPAAPPAYSQPVQPAAPPAYSQPVQPTAPPAAPPIFEPAPPVPPPGPMQPPTLPHKHLPSMGNAPAVARSVLAPARLTVVQTGAVLPLPNADQALLGRSDVVSQFFPDIDLTAHGALDKGVGRRHLRIFVQNGQILAEDQDSTNGTIINGQKQPPRQPLALRDGDTIQLGTLILRFNEL